MAVKVVLDHPEPDGNPRLRRSISTVAGGLLVGIGLLAAIVSFPTGVASVFIVGGFIFGDRLTSEAALVVLAAAVSGTFTAVGLVIGLRLMRRNRELVLLLRRFGYRDATSVATHAAGKTIGKSWRLVTLDDAAVAPLGVPAARRRLLRVVTGIEPAMERVSEFSKSGWFALLTSSWLLVGGFVVLRIEVYDSGESYEPYFDIIDMVMSGHLPVEAVGPSLEGAFALSMIALPIALAGVVGLLAVGAVTMLVFAGVLGFVGSVAESAEAAEQSKQLDVETADEIDVAVSALAAQSRKVIAPRLVVMRVASSLWQPMVTRLATAGSLTIVDVSESTENLLWEIRELRDRLGPRCVFVGEHERVRRLTDRPPSDAQVPALDAELSRLLDDREVLAYTTDPRGKRRFARALRSKLLEAAADAGAAPAPASGEAPERANRRGLTLDTLARLDDIAVSEAIVARDGDAVEPARRERVAQALVDKGFKLAELGRHEEALAVHDTLIARYGDAREPALRERVADALVNNGAVLAALGRFDAELAAYDDVVGRYGEDSEPALRERVAGAMVEKAITLAELDRPQEALTACDDVVTRYGDTADPALHARVARALVTKAAALREAGRDEAALALYADIADRYRMAAEPLLREQVAVALVNRGRVLAALGRPAESLAVLDEAVARLDCAPNAALRVWAAEARVDKAVVLAQLDRVDEATAVHDDVFARLGDTTDPELRQVLNRSLAARFQNAPLRSRARTARLAWRAASSQHAAAQEAQHR